MTTTPIELDVAQYDTHPVLTWTVKDQDGALIDFTPATRYMELYVFEIGAVGNRKRTLWKASPLTKTGTPEDGKASFAVNAPASEFYPTTFESEGLGVRTIEGWLRYRDTAAGTKKWIKRALLVTTESAPPEPA